MSAGAPHVWVLLGGLLLVNSGAAADEPGVRGDQGPWRHGTDELENVNIPLASGRPPCPSDAGDDAGCPLPRDAVLLDQGELRSGSLTGAGLTGWTFYAPIDGRVAKLEIVGAQVQPEGPPKWAYQVKWHRDDGSEKLICGGGPAFAVPHAWSTSGELLWNPDYFSFACLPGTRSSGGVIAKCIKWGVPPWFRANTMAFPDGGIGLTEAYKTLGCPPYDCASRARPDSHEAMAIEFHQACVRMANADYCGEGKPNTIEGTPLWFFSLYNDPPMSGGHLATDLHDGGTYFLEAVWAVESCGKVRPLCLGKKRWNSLPLDATCLDAVTLNKLAQFNLNPEEPGLDPCTDLARLKADGGLLVSYTTYVDKVLVLFKKSWRDGRPDTYLTTSEVELVMPESARSRLDPRAPTYGLATPNLTKGFPGYTQKRVEGPIFSSALPDDIVNSLQSKIVALYRCQASDGSFVLTDNKTCDDFKGSKAFLHNGGVLEGYIFRHLRDEDMSSYRPLKVWRHDAGTFAVSTLQPEGFTYVRELGYLPAIGMHPTQAPIFSKGIPKPRPFGGVNLQSPDSSSPAQTLTGTAPPGTTVIVSVDGADGGTAEAGAHGLWIFPPSPPLAAGSHTASASVVDESGNVIERSPQVPFRVARRVGGCSCSMSEGPGGMLLSVALVLLRASARRRARNVHGEVRP